MIPFSSNKPAYERTDERREAINSKPDIGSECVLHRQAKAQLAYTKYARPAKNFSSILHPSCHNDPIYSIYIHHA